MLRRIRDTFANTSLVDVNPRNYVKPKALERLGFPSGIINSAFDSDLGLLYLASNKHTIYIVGDDDIYKSVSLRLEERTYEVKAMHCVAGKAMLMIITTESQILRLSISGDKHKLDRLDNEEEYYIAHSTMREKPFEFGNLLIGTEDNNVYAIDPSTLSVNIFIPSEYLKKRMDDPEEFRISGLTSSSKGLYLAILCGPNNMMIYECGTNQVIQDVKVEQNITNIHWSRNGAILMSLENGSYMTYNLERRSLNTPPPHFTCFPSDPMPLMDFAVPDSNDAPVLIYMGGLPHPSYADRYIVTLMKSAKAALCLEFGSEVVKFHVIPEKQSGDFQTVLDTRLLVVTQHEVLFVDLVSMKWEEIHNDIMFPVDFSEITATASTSDLADTVWKKLLTHSTFHNNKRNPLRPLKRQHGKTKNSLDARRLYLTGHENGRVLIFSAGSKSCSLLYDIDVQKEFVSTPQSRASSPTPSRSESPQPFSNCKHGLKSGSKQNNEILTGPGDQVVDSGEEGIWPPIRKVGYFDNFLDDIQYQITRLYLDPTTGYLFVGMHCGVVFVYSLNENEKTLTPRSLTEVLFVHKDMNPTEPYMPRTTALHYLPGYQPLQCIEGKSFFLQLKPNTSITSLSFLPRRNFLAIAGDYGFLVFDITEYSTVYKESFASTSQSANAADRHTPFNAFKTMKKSIRQTFRRKKTMAHHAIINHDNKVNLDGSLPVAEEECVPVERAIEARTTTNQERGWAVSLVRWIECMSNGKPTDMIFVAQQNFIITSYVVAERPGQRAIVEKSKALYMTHAAPVVEIKTFYEEKNKNEKVQRLMIITEEQVRGFSLTSFKTTRYKIKLTATEGARIRKSAIVSLYKESFEENSIFLCLYTLDGSILVYSLANPKIRASTAVTGVRDLYGAKSLVLAHHGEAFSVCDGGRQINRFTISSSSISWEGTNPDAPWPFEVVTTDHANE